MAFVEILSDTIVYKGAWNEMTHDKVRPWPKVGGCYYCWQVHPLTRALLVSFPITSTIHLLLKTEILWTLLGAGRDLQLHLHLPNPFGWRLSSTLFVYIIFGWSQTPSQLHRWHLNPVRGKEEGCSIRSRLAGGYKEASLTELSQSMPSGVLSSKIDCFILSPDTRVHIRGGEE